MSRVGETMMKWLGRIDHDQNLQGIDQLDDNTMGGLDRKWFRRQDLTPTLATGFYNPETERYVLGIDTLRGALTTQVDTATSAATDTLTVPAGRRYLVVGVYVQNATRAATYTLEYTPNGGTAAIIGGGSGNYLAASVWPLLGGGYTGIGAAYCCQPNEGLEMNEGDVLTTTNTNFVAADNTDNYFVYYDLPA